MHSACAIFLSVGCPAIQYFSTLSHKRRRFSEEKLLDMKLDLIWFPLHLVSETFLILRSQRDTVINASRSSCKVPVIILVWFNQIWIFTTDFRKMPKYDILKIRSAGVELFHADRQTDRRSDITKLKVLFAILRTRLKKKLRGLSPRANYTDRAAAAGRRS